MAKVNEIPLFITAKTKEELVSAMWKNNSNLMHQLQYFDIQFVNNEWVAWYFYDAAKLKQQGKR